MLNVAQIDAQDGIIVQPLNHKPDFLALHQRNPEQYPYLLESTSGNRRLARYDILFAFPGNQITQDSSSDTKFLDRLKLEWRQSRDDSQSVERCGEFGLPFTGGWFLFLAYELAAEIENLPSMKFDSTLPVATATRIPLALIYDHIKSKTWIVAESQYPDVDRLMAAMLDDIQKIDIVSDSEINVISLSEEPAQNYLDSVIKAKQYIHDGDIFQANLSRKWIARLGENSLPHHLYSRLRKSNPSPFSGLARINSDTTIISSSPERLAEIRRGNIYTRPIAGTYPRSSDPVLDVQQSTELLAHPKERAEHIMLIDLERNDLGRVCQPGTIHVPELMVLESYRHVHHIVSEVSGKLRAETDPTDVIAAIFPGGTITGCPKVRCMAIISELENSTRGAYTGSMGYLNHNGTMDLNILIRTMTQHGSELTFRAGAGIVADSNPDRELAETQAKAEGMIRALQ